MRVVFDTNVFVSALLAPQGIPSQLFQLWEVHLFDILVSEASLEELARVLRYPKIRKRLRVSDAELDDYVRLLRAKVVVVAPQERVEAVTDDASDNVYLEIALAGKADCVVTGDRHLLQLEQYQGILILTPADFLDYLTSLSENP
ncbi:MAG: putative toxin-antitoxin system toxin component, PIN family [Caldilineaceae bacterium]|nr:putative toxin-antitoxin system toxin component, PIN family [Caldilineaceae bacterium]